jgi:hypothetical protein
MSRKTFHYLEVGDYVVIERIVAKKGTEIEVVEQFTRAMVMESLPDAKTLKLTVDFKCTTASISKQSGWVWGKDAADEGGCWRIAPALARSKGSQVHLSDSITPDLPTTVTLERHHFLYPGQPLVLAACVLREYHNPESAAIPRVYEDGKVTPWCHAESNAKIPGAGNQTTYAVDALMRYRKHGSIDEVINELHAAWKRTCPSDKPDAFVTGQKLAEKLEPDLRKALAGWL